MEKPKRKVNRFKDYDYSSIGVYFITICAKDRRNLFWGNVGASIARPQDVELTLCGKTVENAIQNISEHYPAVVVDNYVIMPNHVHLLLQIISDDSGRPMVAPTISTVIQHLKGYVTKQAGFTVWQKTFHDHIIRCDRDYRKIYTYIDNNPITWEKDCFFTTA